MKTSEVGGGRWEMGVGWGRREVRQKQIAFHLFVNSRKKKEVGQRASDRNKLVEPQISRRRLSAQSPVDTVREDGLPER